MFSHNFCTYNAIVYTFTFNKALSIYTIHNTYTHIHTHNRISGLSTCISHVYIKEYFIRNQIFHNVVLTQLVLFASFSTIAIYVPLICKQNYECVCLHNTILWIVIRLFRFIFFIKSFA